MAMAETPAVRKVVKIVVPPVMPKTQAAVNRTAVAPVRPVPAPAPMQTVPAAPRWAPVASIAPASRNNGQKENVVETQSISKIYGQYENKVYALNNVSLKISKGEFVAILGPSGSGKSTMLHMMGCLDRPSSGKILINGRDMAMVSGAEVATFRGKNMGFVFQSYNIIPRLTVMENVMLPGMIAGINRSELESRANELLKETGILHRADHKGVHLSGGEQQRVAIARAFINNPTIIFADEPTGALDTRSSDEIMGILKKMNEQHGVTVVIITHNPKQATDYVRRIIRIKDGQIVGDEVNVPRAG